jgi:flagellar protein FliS
MFVNMSIAKIEEISEAYPSQLIVILYDEAISSLIAAMDAIDRGDIEGRFNATKRSADVIAELYVSLDMELGGEIAASLGAIYNHILTQLPQINFSNDAMVAERLIHLLQPIRDAWFELDERIRCNVADAEALDSVELAAAVVARDALSAEGAR